MIKNMKNNIIKILFGFLAVTLGACLDDDKAPLDPSDSQNVLEFLDPSVPVSPAGAIYPAWVTSFPVSPQATFDQVISYSGAHGNDKDIQVTLAIDPVALDEFNAQMVELGSATYEILPEENYDISSMTVTIPKGQTKAKVTITVYPDKFDLSKNFAVPLRIASASSGTVSAHFSVAILATVVKNKYDGVYEIEEGSMVDVTNPAFTGLYPKTVELRTVNGNTVSYYDRGEILAGHIFDAGGGASYYGGFLAQFTFDETNTVVSVVNAFGQGNNNRSGKLDPDPAAPVPVMTFNDDGTPDRMEIWYIMRQLNTSTDRAFWKETYVYVGPRD